MYRLDRNNKIFVYGAGPIGQGLVCALLDKGYDVGAFIDKSDVGAPCPVLRFEEYLERWANSDDRVIVTLNNGLLHDKIAAEVYKKGITHIIFLPIQTRISTFDRQQLRYAYIQVVNHHNFTTDIPEYCLREGKYTVIRDYGDDYISFICPLQELYVGCTHADDRYFQSSSGRVLWKYYQKKASDFKPYVNLFECLEEGEYIGEKLHEYMTINNRTTDKEKRQLFCDRQQLYHIYIEAMGKDISFFGDAPIQCYYCNEKIMIVNGYHRFFFLLSRGFKEAPILLNKQDYNRLISDDKRRLV